MPNTILVSVFFLGTNRRLSTMSAAWASSSGVLMPRTSSTSTIRYDAMRLPAPMTRRASSVSRCSPPVTMRSSSPNSRLGAATYAPTLISVSGSAALPSTSDDSRIAVISPSARTTRP